MKIVISPSGVSSEITTSPLQTVYAHPVTSSILEPSVYLLQDDFFVLQPVPYWRDVILRIKGFLNITQVHPNTTLGGLSYPPYSLTQSSSFLAVPGDWPRF